MCWGRPNKLWAIWTPSAWCAAAAPFPCRALRSLTHTHSCFAASWAFHLDTSPPRCPSWHTTVSLLWCIGLKVTQTCLPHHISPLSLWMIFVESNEYIVTDKVSVTHHWSCGKLWRGLYWVIDYLATLQRFFSSFISLEISYFDIVIGLLMCTCAWSTSDVCVGVHVCVRASL